MKKNHLRQSLSVIFTLASTLAIVSCDRTSSPEGRMSLKIEGLQQQMIDSLKIQNRAILDSLGKIREDLKALKESGN